MSTNFNSGLSAAGFPTSSDIWLELDGKKVAVVQSYNCKTTRSSYSVEAFGEEEPVATVQGSQNYVIQLTRLYATDQAIADGLDFYRSVCSKWKGALRLGGHLLFEVGMGQSQDVENLMDENGFEEIHSLPDTQGILRVVSGIINE